MAASFLIIDIFDFNKLTMSIWRDGEIKRKIWRKPPGRHLNILLCLDKFLKQEKIKLKDLSGIILLQGGGSFSGVRQAAAILNAIYLWEGIPVLGLDKRKYGDDWQKIIHGAEKYFRHSRKKHFIKPIYSGPPNITCPTI